MGEEMEGYSVCFFVVSVHCAISVLSFYGGSGSALIDVCVLAQETERSTKSIPIQNVSRKQDLPSTYFLGPEYT